MLYLFSPGVSRGLPAPPHPSLLSDIDHESTLICRVTHEFVAKEKMRDQKPQGAIRILDGKIPRMLLCEKCSRCVKCNYNGTHASIWQVLLPSGLPDRKWLLSCGSKDEKRIQKAFLSRSLNRSPELMKQSRSGAAEQRDLSQDLLG